MNTKNRESKTVKGQKKIMRGLKTKNTVVCVNKRCKLRKAGCKGFEACPGYEGL